MFGKLLAWGRGAAPWLIVLLIGFLAPRYIPTMIAAAVTWGVWRKLLRSDQIFSPPITDVAAVRDGLEAGERLGYTALVLGAVLTLSLAGNVARARTLDRGIDRLCALVGEEGSPKSQWCEQLDGIREQADLAQSFGLSTDDQADTTPF